MKKIFKTLFVLLLVGAGIYFLINYLFSGRSTFQSIYLVPENSVFIIETDDAYDAWGKIIHSKSWEKIGHVPYFSELNKELENLDSLLSTKKALLKIISKRKILVSLHEYQPKKYDYLFILNVGNAAGLRNPEKLISSVLGENYPLTKRDYKGSSVYELLDKKSGEMYFFSFIKDKIALSTNFKLVEASIDEENKMALGRDLEFIDVSKRITGKGLFNVYINYSHFPQFLESKLGKITPGIQQLRHQLTYSAFSFDIGSDGLISLEGYTDVNDSVASFYTMALETGSGGLKSAEIIPNGAASLVKISFTDAAEYYHKTIADLNAPEYLGYKDNIEKIEKKLKINVEENIFSWIDDEIALLQTQPSNLGKDNEFAVIIKGKNESDPLKNLDFLAHQIQKNTPVKIKEVIYEGYQIRYISFPGLLKMFFGKTIGKIDKPYYTLIGEYAVFSNHPQTIKNIIDGYRQGKVLEYSDSFDVFKSRFENKSSAFAYINVPVFFNNLKEFVSIATWDNLNSNKNIITCFPRIGFQINEKDKLLHLLIKAEYDETPEKFAVQRFENDFISLFTSENSLEDTVENVDEWYNPAIIINDLDSRELKVNYENGNLKYSIDLKNGLKHGTFKEYFEDGTLRIKGRFKNDLKDGDWKLYGEDGNIIEEKVFDIGKEITE
jgi:hypothetical protein